MELNRSFGMGILLTVACFMGCGATFGYKYYAPQPASWLGTLLGDVPADDLPFTSCSPTPGNENPCVVMMSSEFFRAKAEILTLRQELSDCQHKEEAK